MVYFDTPKNQNHMSKLLWTILYVIAFRLRMNNGCIGMTASILFSSRFLLI